MHSRIGPAIESELVYAARARIEEMLNSAAAKVVLYDVGMGTGANALAVLNRIAEKTDARGSLELFSFESKPEGLLAALRNIDAFPEFRPWETRLRDLLSKAEARFNIGGVEIAWRLLTGDFYTRIAECPPPDAIFFDFYSPKIVPELWTLARFCEIRGKMGDHPASLYTYSAATPVRLSLLAAGFFIGSGVPTGMKNETTIAATHFELLSAPLDRTWLTKLTSSASIAGPEFTAMKTAVANHPQWSKPLPQGT